MGFKNMEKVFAIPPGFLAPDERLVLLAYAYHANDTFDVRPTAWPSEQTVAEECGWSDARRVRSRVKALEEAGWLKKARDTKAGRRNERGQFRPPIWVLNLPELGEWSWESVLAKYGMKPTAKARALTDRATRMEPAAQGEPPDRRLRVSPRTSGSGWAEPAAQGEPPNRKGTGREEPQERNKHLAPDSHPTHPDPSLPSREGEETAKVRPRRVSSTKAPMSDEEWSRRANAALRRAVS